MLLTPVINVNIMLLTPVINVNIKQSGIWKPILNLSMGILLSPVISVNLVVPENNIETIHEKSCIKYICIYIKLHVYYLQEVILQDKNMN